MTGCDVIEPQLAAYAFGALNRDDRLTVENHLTGCAQCRQILAELAALPGLLDIAGNTATSIHRPPLSLEASVIATLPTHQRSRSGRGSTRRSRRLRVPGPAAVALAVLIVGGLWLGHPWTRAVNRGVRLELVPSARDSAARATVRLLPHPWGTEVDLNAHGLAPTHGSQIYEVWFVSPRGRVSAGTFRVASRRSVTVRLAAAAQADQYQQLGITREPNGLDPARRGPNILRGSVPN